MVPIISTHQLNLLFSEVFNILDTEHFKTLCETFFKGLTLTGAPPLKIPPDMFAYHYNASHSQYELEDPAPFCYQKSSIWFRTSREDLEKYYH